MSRSRPISILRAAPFAEIAGITLIALLILVPLALVSARERARRDVVTWMQQAKDAQSTYVQTEPLLLEVSGAAKQLERTILSRGHGELERTQDGLRIEIA